MCALLAFCTALVSCDEAAANRVAPAAQNVRQAAEVRPERADAGPEEHPKDVSDSFAREDSLTLNGYEVSKRGRASGSTYAVLKRGGSVVAKFDGGDYGLGVATAFGAFPFLGGGARQLAVSLTVPRGGRHWVVDLSSESPCTDSSTARPRGDEVWVSFWAAPPASGPDAERDTKARAAGGARL